ncbi:hypothetical protein KUTeg_006853 [Tegillarca granosa]|uniref:Small subunit processome component 20 homolog n=1 Tax=Tegillarca granosa TaxID=220873 RepID=A0ABQ9FBK0_TEGGR|nr:hypothetical protein KUTeg_006853 [Tegillarca granosa]
MIASHAKGLDRHVFWQIYYSQLQQSAKQTEAELKADLKDTREETLMDIDNELFSIFHQQYQNGQCQNTTLDYRKYRFQLWKAMQLFPEKVEPKSKDVCPLLFSFLQNEYYKTDLNAAPKQNILKQVMESEAETEATEDSSDEEEEELEMPEVRTTRSMANKRNLSKEEKTDNIVKKPKEEEGKKIVTKEKEDKDKENRNDNVIKSPTTKLRKMRKQGSKKLRRATTSDLIVHLELFAKFKNPKSLYMEADLRNLYEELLTHRDTDVQKIAFKCLMTYKYPYLTPYRENFEKLLDDKTFRNEIVLFSIDNENSIVATDHRSQLLPILMRVLYGKILQKTGNDNAGKTNAYARRSIIFRFLNGCTRQELCSFMEMVFAPLKYLITDNPYSMVIEVMNSLNLAEVFPLRRMSGALNTVDMIVKKLGHLLEDYLPNLFKIILGLLATIATCLERRKEITQTAINNLKNLRSLAINRLIQFFENFDTYDFTPFDVDAVFKVAVWPQIKKLPFEGIYHPTALLKLLHTWTKQNRLFVLLGKYEDDSKGDNPLTYIFQLLNAKDVDPSVTSVIIEIVENLLTPRESEEHVPASLSINNSLVDISDNSIEAYQSIGVTLLMPHVPSILQHLETFVTSLKAHLNKKHGKCKELTILSRISEFVTDEAQCTTLISLLLPFLQKGVPRTQVIEQDILTSIYNLMKIVEDRCQFYRDICHLFATLELRQSRTLLCNILNVIKEKKESIQEVCQFVTEMNSWNPKHMDEPDYMKRLDAYKKINETVKSMEDLDVDFLLPVIHNACFFIRLINDMSIRDYSTHCLTTIIKQFEVVSFSQDVYRELISQCLLSEVKAGIRNKDETVRHEFITLLSTLVEVFPDQASFSDLIGLKDKDPEADFFENIKHIQIHRRGRALRKLIKYLDKQSVKQETMMSYFLPLTSSFINDETYSKQHDLQDAAIETLGYLCRRLPWNQYLHQLKHYLYLLPKRLQSQKLIVRVIVAVLDGFHFDLSQSQYRVTLTPVPKDQTPSQEKGDATNNDNKIDEAVTDEDIVNPEETEASESVIEDIQDTPINDTDNDTDQMTVGYVKCPANLATKIHTVIVKSILPQLHKALTQKAKSEGEHKLAKSTYAEDTEILRVPMALAMVKLIQNLPEGSLRHSLPGILIKVCNFLKSRAKDIRDIARDTLVKILMSLGPSYFPYILTEMRGTLQRGYQLHVLSYTVYILLKNVSSIIKPGDLDVCQTKLQEIFNEELFGNVAEEKEVEGITVKVFEAKTVKSYDSYQILSQYIGKKSLISLITPLKQILDSTRSHQVAKKVQEVMKKITAGLIDNANIDIETLLVFIHGLISETLPVISETKGEKEKSNEKNERRKPESCLLLPATPKRGGEKPKANKKTNIHILVEFGLQLLHMSLKKSRINQNDKKHLMMLDPFIEGLAECLYSKHVRINSLSLRCLSWLLKFPLPSLKTHIEKLANGMFILLRNYASAGAAKGDNLDLVTTAFKTVTVLVRDITYHTIDNSQLQVLLTFCEEDLHDYKRQSTAFTLLKAILSRKLNIPEIHQLMTKVEGLSITADSPHVRRECRQVTLQYLLEYALGKKLVKHLEFYVTQLSYEMEMGRESALEMLATVFSSFPQSVLMKHAGFFFIPMSAALVNDDSAKCRKLTALAIKSLLEKIDHNTRNSLFSIAVKWFKDEKLRHQTLASQLCGLFVEVESGKFEHHLSEILPLIEQQLEPGKFESIHNQSFEQDVDHLLYNTLNTLCKILQECNILRSSKWTENMNVIWEHIEKHLLHPHVWVRLVSAQLYGLLFMAWKPEDVIGSHDVQKQEYLQVGSYKKIETLAVLFCSQLQSQYLNEDLAGQVVKNIIFITKVAKCYHTSNKLENERKTENDREMEEGNEESSDGQDWRRLSLPWLSRKMIREANHEAISTPKQTIKRSSIFKWMAAVSLDLGADILPTILHILLPCLQREISDQTNTQDSTLKNLAQEVVEILKRIVGVEVFTKVYNEVQKSRAVRKGDRKRQRALEAVSNPDIAARRKIKKNLAKQEAKKRKLETFRTSKKIKKQKLQSLAVIDS